MRDEGEEEGVQRRDTPREGRVRARKRHCNFEFATMISHALGCTISTRRKIN